jgi:hypothetical protein
VPEPERNKHIPLPNALEVSVRIVGFFLMFRSGLRRN